MTHPAYITLAKVLDSLPNGFPATEDGTELRLLESIYTPEESELCAELRTYYETPRQIAERLGRDYKETREMLKAMSRKGQIKIGKTEGGMGFRLIPFAIGVYEYQIHRIDEEMAARFEDYYKHSDVIITHAGAGTIFKLLELNKKIIVIPNLERVDKHQRDLANFLGENEYALVAWNLDDLLDCLRLVESFQPSVFKKEPFFKAEEIASFILS